MRILYRTELERKLMVHQVGRRHFYVKKGGPKKVLNYAESRFFHVFLRFFHMFFTLLTLFSRDYVIRRRRRRYLSYGARFCADR